MGVGVMKLRMEDAERICDVPSVLLMKLSFYAENALIKQHTCDGHSLWWDTISSRLARQSDDGCIIVGDN